ncbi:MAG TPA: hypothetical protein VH392_12300, partial [Sphingomicrobium sp.]
MATKLQAAKTTVAGGIIFLLPLVLMLFLLGKALKFAEQLSQPIVNLIGVRAVGGVGLRTI